MNLIFRLLGVLIGALWRPKLGAADISRLRFRVWPLDLDINLHLTNSRYFALMDLGRTDHILRSGVWRIMRRDRLAVVLGGAAMRFRRSLAPFEKVSLATRLLGYDERWIYMEQVFTGSKGVACIAVLRGAFVKDGKIVTPKTVLEPVALDELVSDLPSWVKDWAEVEAAFAG